MPQWSLKVLKHSPSRVPPLQSETCVEGAVVAEALEILKNDSPGQLVKFGYSDDEAFAVGLTCGGVVHLFIQPLNW